MRRLIFTIGILFCVLNINAKTDTLNISIDDKNKLLADNNVSENDSTANANIDTTRIMFGKKGITVIKRKDGKNSTTIHIEETKEKYLNGEFDKDSCDDCYGPIKKHPLKYSNIKFSLNLVKFNPHWNGLELTLNNFMTSDFSTSLPAGSRFLELNTGRSIGVRLNLLEQAIATSRTSGFVTGLGLEINSYYFDSENSNITKSNGYIVQKYKNPNAGDYSKNKLKDTYLTVPLMYEIQAPLGNIKKPLYISAGVIGGLKLGSRTKEYYTLYGNDRKDVVKGDFYLSPIRYGYQARIGFRSIHLVATYYESGLFSSGKGPKVHPFDIGIKIINW